MTMKPVRIPWTHSKHAAPRAEAASLFVSHFLECDVHSEVLQGDASPRRYFRFFAAEKSYILLDSPLPPRTGAFIFENDFTVSSASIDLFIERTEQFERASLPVPTLVAADPEQGFLLLEDFGDLWLWHDLYENATEVMPSALDLLGWWQQQTRSLFTELSPYDRDFLRSEVRLFTDYFLPYVNERVDNKKLLEPLHELIDQLCVRDSQALGCCVHRDWHSRNLMSCSDGKIGILDYQDALWGSPAYDLVSLTRDCYLRYPAGWVRDWEESFRQQYHAYISAGDWRLQCDAVSLQRHLKVLGIFVRLAGEGKSSYLQYLPQVTTYALEEAARLHSEKIVDLSTLIGILARASIATDR